MTLDDIPRDVSGIWVPGGADEYRRASALLDRCLARLKAGSSRTIREALQAERNAGYAMSNEAWVVVHQALLHLIPPVSSDQVFPDGLPLTDVELRVTACKMWLSQLADEGTQSSRT